MPRRGENIHKRKDGRWEGRYQIQMGGDKNKKYISIYGKTYKEVKEKLRYSQTTAKSTTLKPTEKTFEDILYMWLETNHLKYKGATELKYAYLINRHIVPELGKMNIKQLNTFVINKFIEEKLASGRLDHKGGLSNTYVRSIALIINASLQFAMNEELCIPLKLSIHKPPIPSKKKLALTIKEQQQIEKKLMSEIDETKLGIMLSLYMGLRIGEVCALTWNKINFNEGILHVSSTITRIQGKKDSNQKTLYYIDIPKTKSSIREIPIPSRLLSIIEVFKTNAKSEYVISNKESFLNPRTYEYRFHKFLDSCNVRQFNYHLLRHTFATRCIEAGVDVKTLSEILGHANVSITLNTYVHSSLELKKMQIEKILS